MVSLICSPFLQTKFEKQYANADDELFRRELWEKNVAEIDLHNKEFQEGKHTYTLGENKFSDMVIGFVLSFCISFHFD